MDNTEKEVEEIDLRDTIIDYLKLEEERDLAWLSRKTGIKYPTLYSCFTQRLFRVNDDNLKKINEVLGTDFK